MVSASRSSPSPGLAVQLLGCGHVSLPGTYAFYHLILKWGLLSGKPSPVCLQRCARGGLALATSKLQSLLFVAMSAWQGQWARALQARFASETPTWGTMQPFWLFSSNKPAGSPLVADSSVKQHRDDRNSVNAGQVKWLNNSKISLLRCLQPVLSTFLFQHWCGRGCSEFHSKSLHSVILKGDIFWTVIIHISAFN